jgi:outer membrane immunogenic protein
MKKFLIAALLAGVATSAFAADLPTMKGPPPTPTVYAPAFTWTGFYGGINGGWGFGDLSNSNFSNPNGGLIGGTVGYNYQMNQFVIGGEADLDWADIYQKGTYANASAAGTNKFSNSWMTTERLRAGVAMDRTLIFLTGGYAGVQTRGWYNDTLNGISGAQSAWRNGGVIGAGVEYAFTNNITAKVEYLWIPLQDRSYFAGTPDGESNSYSINLIRAGLNYKF